MRHPSKPGSSSKVQEIFDATQHSIPDGSAGNQEDAFCAILSNPDEIFKDLEDSLKKHLVLENELSEINAEWLTYEVVQKERQCVISMNTGIHIKRKTGVLELRLHVPDDKIDGKDLRVIAFTQRKNDPYRHKPMNTVCAKHYDESTNKKVLLSLSKDAEYLPKDADDPSNDDVLFPAVLEPFAKTLKYTFECLDSCLTFTDKEGKVEHLKEMARDTNLVLTLIDYNEPHHIIARRKIDIWVKALINDRDLKKNKRREEKGGAAQVKKVELQKDVRVKLKKDLEKIYLQYAKHSDEEERLAFMNELACKAKQERGSGKIRSSCGGGSGQGVKTGRIAKARQLPKITKNTIKEEPKEESEVEPQEESMEEPQEEPLEEPQEEPLEYQIGILGVDTDEPPSSVLSSSSDPMWGGSISECVDKFFAML